MFPPSVAPTKKIAMNQICPKCGARNAVLIGRQWTSRKQRIKCRDCGECSILPGRPDEFEAEAWAFGNPRAEAYQCLKIANANGGVPRMRELIKISNAELQQLQKFSVAFPELRSRIERAIQFRAQVLEHFDRLVSGSDEEENKPEPVTAAEYADFVAGLMPVPR